jgi:hypothetical protein
MFLGFASWLQHTPVSLALQHQAGWLWPACETLHFAGLALLIGVAGMFDLRLLGFMRRVPVSVVHEFMPWALAGFACNLLTGLVFVTAQPALYFANYTWWLKVALLLIAGLNAAIFERVYSRRASEIPAGGDTPFPIKIIAGVSLASWFGVLWAGRMLPFIKLGPAARL